MAVFLLEDFQLRFAAFSNLLILNIINVGKKSCVFRLLPYIFITSLKKGYSDSRLSKLTKFCIPSTHFE
jgi:hypothetical protein